MSIASTPEPEHGDRPGTSVVANANDTECSNTHAPFVDYVLVYAASHTSPETSSMPDETKGLFENSTGNVSPIAKPNKSNEACNVYFMHQLSLKEPPSYSHSTGGIASNVYPDSSSQIKTTLFDINESMPSLMPLRLFTSMQSLATVEADADVHMHHSTETLPIPTTGSMPYHGPSHHDRRTVITFDRLTQSDAEGYLSTDYAKFNNYHSPYIPNVVHAIESFCFCQDELIANDWNIHLFRDETYPGHVVIPGDTKLSTGGPRSGRTWQERI